MRATGTGFGLTLAVVTGLAGGCGKNSDRPAYREVEGRITAINRETEEVSMTTFNEKKGKYMTLTGRLAPDAEIFIDGQTARFEDIRVDDRVRVAGQVEDHDGERRLVANRVAVTRLASDEIDAATQPGEDADQADGESEPDGG
jgi:hypothetical protein